MSEVSSHTESLEDNNSSVDEYEIDHNADLDLDYLRDGSSSESSFPTDGRRTPSPLPYVGENIVEDDLLYCRLQEELYLKNFSLEALQLSNSLRSFIRYLPQYNNEEILISALLDFKKKASLSRENGNELLNLIKLFQPATRVPRDWRAVVRDVDRHVCPLKDTTIRRTVPWPESFQMDLFDEPGHATLPPVELIARDLLELIATKLVCPTTIYINKTEVQFSYDPQQLQDGSPCVSSLMSSDYARYSEEAIKAIDPNGILLPIITYADGVALGLRNKVCMHRRKK
jgi:hypothetical protein